MKYEEFNYTSKIEVEQLLQSTDSEKRIAAVIGMINGIEDRNWLEEKLLLLIGDEDFWVVKNAITGLGDIARIYGELDVKKVKAAFKQVTDERLKGTIDSTLDDFRIFLKKS